MRRGWVLKIISEKEQAKIISMYSDDKCSLRYISKVFNTDHHRIKRILEFNGIKISNDDRVVTRKKGYKKKPFTIEHRRNIGLAGKGRVPVNKGKKMPKSSLYKNMQKHLKYNIELEFLQQFNDVEKLKILNRIIRNTRLPDDFSDDDYKNYIKKFYDDEKFNRTYNNWLEEGKKKYAKPSIDHIKPLSKGGTWDLYNLQIIPWCINKAKSDFMPEEWEHIRQKYLKESW